MARALIQFDHHFAVSRTSSEVIHFDGRLWGDLEVEGAVATGESFCGMEQYSCGR